MEHRVGRARGWMENRNVESRKQDVGMVLTGGKGARCYTICIRFRIDTDEI